MLRQKRTFAALLTVTLCAPGCLFGLDAEENPPGLDDVGSSSDTGVGLDTDSSADVGVEADVGLALCGEDERVESNTCTTCAPGTTREAGDDPSQGDTSCAPIECEANERVLSNACVPCAPGERNMPDDVASGPDTTCDPPRCAGDEFVLDGACAACLPGTRNMPDDDPLGQDTACDTIECAEDELVVGNLCEVCPAGTTNDAGDDASGMNTLCDVTLCGEDERVLSNRCVRCVLGRTNMAGDEASGANTVCDANLCPPNQRVQGNACVPCEQGTQIAGGGDPSGDDTTCSPIICLADTFVLNNLCTACPAGTTNEAGDDASDMNTLCDVTRCLQDERVLNNACVSCPVGTTNTDGGDDASGADTLCDAITCQVDERVQDNACVACLPGSTNVGGDDASGLNTTCDATRCVQDERVLNNACVSCPSGTTNVGGDDASGADTTCDTSQCDADEYVLSNACAPCAPGTENDAGDPTSGGDTMCERIVCARDQFVLSNACLPCGTGFTNPAGDPADGPDTSCAAIICGDDEYVSASTCMTCPAGEINVGGDPVSGPDTTCDGDCVAVLGLSCDDFTQAYIKGSHPTSNDTFGASVDLDGDTLVVGVPGEDSSATGVGGDASNNTVPATSNSGAVFVFVRSGTTWTQQAYLKASNTDANDRFGESVAIDGDTVVVGATGEDSNATGIDGDETDESSNGSGAAYVFERTGGVWAQSAYIKGPGSDPGDAFGKDVAIDGDLIAVSATGEASRATGVDGDASNNDSNLSGAVFLFSRSLNTWTPAAYLKASNTGAGDGFGTSVAVSGNTVAVGAILEDGGGSNAGAVYIFTRTFNGWEEQAYLNASNSGANDQFGVDVALDADTLVVGAWGESSDGSSPTDDSAPRSGAAYVFTRAVTTWSQAAYLKASNADEDDEFGRSVSVDSGRIAVGAVGEDCLGHGLGGNPLDNSTPPDAGAVYLLALLPDGSWSELAYIKASNTDGRDEFGAAVSLSGDTLAAGAPLEDSNASGVDGDQSINSGSGFGSGAVYIRKIAP